MSSNVVEWQWMTAQTASNEAEWSMSAIGNASEGAWSGPPHLWVRRSLCRVQRMQLTATFDEQSGWNNVAEQRSRVPCCVKLVWTNSGDDKTCATNVVKASFGDGENAARFTYSDRNTTSREWRRCRNGPFQREETGITCRWSRDVDAKRWGPGSAADVDQKRTQEPRSLRGETAACWSSSTVALCV